MKTKQPWENRADHHMGRELVKREETEDTSLWSFCKGRKKLWISTRPVPGPVLFKTLKMSWRVPSYLQWQEWATCEELQTDCMRWSVKGQMKFSGKKPPTIQQKQSQCHIKPTGSELTTVTSKKKYGCNDRQMMGSMEQLLSGPDPFSQKRRWSVGQYDRGLQRRARRRSVLEQTVHFTSQSKNQGLFNDACWHQVQNKKRSVLMEGAVGSWNPYQTMVHLQNACFGSRDTEQLWKEFHEEALNRKWYQVPETHQAETSRRPGHCAEH